MRDVNFFVISKNYLLLNCIFFFLPNANKILFGADMQYIISKRIQFDIPGTVMPQAIKYHFKTD